MKYDVIASSARAQLEAYFTLTWIDDQVVDASGVQDAFAVSTHDGDVHQARRLLFATGVSDALPDVAGSAERWGTSVFHCPFLSAAGVNDQMPSDVRIAGCRGDASCA